MKKLTTFLLVILLSLNFTSCSDNEVITEQPQENALKSFQLKRDASGRYSLDYEVADNTDAVSVKNIDNQTNEIYLRNSNDVQQRNHSNEFMLDDNKLKIGFVNANLVKGANISVEDENITFGKDNEGSFLSTYSVKSNEDGTYQLNFKVNSNVKTEFIYNEDIKTFEVHLSNGKAENNEFSRTLEMPEIGTLKIDFVNHNENQSRAYSAKESVRRKPRVSVGTGNEGDA
ncbi:MAG: hypothetical protein ACPGUU_03415 [Flavobacteriaceae bacterium]